MNDHPHIAILGAGPIGLEAALAAAEHGLSFTVYEAAATVAGHVTDWGHVRLFTPWSQSVSPRMRARLAAAGFAVPAEAGHCPRGHDLVQQVYEPLAALPEIAVRLELSTRLLAVSRHGLLKHEEIGTGERARQAFRLLLEAPDGARRIARADIVFDCTGTWSNPHAVGDGGIPAPGETELEARIVRRIPDLDAEEAGWAGQTILLVGAGHSAQTAARDLAALAARRPGTRVLWALRAARPSFAVVPDDPLVARAALTAAAQQLVDGASPAVETLAGVVVEALAETPARRLAVTLREGNGAGREVEVDRVLALVGSVGDDRLYRQLQVHECYATSGPMKLAAALLGADSGSDCLAQTSHGVEALKSPEPGFFILGAKSYGRNATFLLRVGWEQVEEVMEEVVGTRARARS